MARDWESSFTSWAQGPSATEHQRCENAEKQIRQAIRDSEKLKNRNIVVFTQGSYRNRVNVRRDSDVDIGVLCYDTYFPDYIFVDDNIKARINENFIPATYHYATFKNELEEALKARFGYEGVKRGDKAFDIKANSQRVEADVAAFFEHRRHTSEISYESGVQMLSDSGKTIINWPEQHYSNGVNKNDRTSRQFKRIVRVLKSLSNEMSKNGIKSAEVAPSFLIECLVWNTKNDCFDKYNYVSKVRSVLAHLYKNTMNDELCKEWAEVSELKYLFRSSQPWTREGAHQFISDAWDYVGFD